MFIADFLRLDGGQAIRVYFLPDRQLSAFRRDTDGFLVENSWCATTTGQKSELPYAATNFR